MSSQDIYRDTATRVASAIKQFFPPFLDHAKACARPIRDLYQLRTFAKRQSLPGRERFIADAFDRALAACHNAAQTLAESSREQSQRPEVAQQTTNSLRTAFLNDSFSEMGVALQQTGDTLRELGVDLAARSTFAASMTAMAEGAAIGKAAQWVAGGNLAHSTPAAIGAWLGSISHVGKHAALQRSEQDAVVRGMATLFGEIEKLPTLLVDQYLTVVLHSSDSLLKSQAVDSVRQRATAMLGPARVIADDLLCFYALDIDRVRNGRAIYGDLYDGLGSVLSAIPVLGGELRAYKQLEEHGKRAQERYPIERAIADLESAVQACSPEVTE